MDNPFKDCPLQGETRSITIKATLRDQIFEKEEFMG
jgi:hypothetical protein